MRDLGQPKLNLGGAGDPAGLTPVKEVGGGQVQEKHKQRLAEIIAALNDLFEGERTDGDKVAFCDGWAAILRHRRPDRAVSDGARHAARCSTGTGSACRSGARRG